MFFFFKQKTAYEMRISDWSSDVCSSDLQPSGAEGSDALEFSVKQVKLQAGRVFLRPAGSRPEGIVLEDLDLEVNNVAANSAMPAKIGRASCRERVCQYV